MANPRTMIDSAYGGGGATTNVRQAALPVSGTEALERLKALVDQQARAPRRGRRRRSGSKSVSSVSKPQYGTGKPNRGVAPIRGASAPKPLDYYTKMSSSGGGRSLDLTKMTPEEIAFFQQALGENGFLSGSF